MATAPSEAAYGRPLAKPLATLKDVDDLVRKMQLIRTSRNNMESQWKLNLAFYKGNQYAFRNRFDANRIQSLPTEDGDKPRYRVRLVSNQIITGAHSLLSKYTKTKPVITASPSSSAQSDVKAAQMAERLFEFWWDQLRLDDKLEEALLWAIIAGQGYWKIDWDPFASKQMKFLLGPDGKPILEDNLKEAFRSSLQKYGIEPQEKTVYMGDVRVQALSPFQVYLDPTAKVFDDCKWAVCLHPMDPMEVKSRFGVDLPADAVSTTPDVSLPFNGSQNSQEKDVRNVYIGYFKPQPGLPDGRYVVWVENPNMILKDEKWPYPTHDLPLVKFPGLRVPGAIYDTSHVEQAIPHQKELNRSLSQIVEYKNLMLRPRVWAPTGSVRTRLTSEPGALYEYNPIAGLKPEVEKLQAIPPYVFEFLSEISSRLKEVFALTEVSEGTVPPNVEAGIAIDLLQELSADRLAPTIKLIEKAIARGGQLMLVLAQQYYIEPRLLKIRGSGGSIQVKKFTQADISGGVTIDVETGSGLPRTRAGRQAQIERWVENGLIPADKAWKYIDMADLKGLSAQFMADEDQANREIEKIVKGEPINPEAVQAAMASVNRGINPDTGDPIQSPDEVQQVIQDAAMKPLTGENYDVHLDVLGFWMKGVEFDAMPTDVRQRAISHWNQTLDAKMALPPQAEPGKLNVNYQIKSTTGPTGASKALARAGVYVSPDEAAEPPLETWLSDSVDKADTDASGPGQEANQLSQAAAVQLESTSKIADAAQQAQLRKATHAQDTLHTEDQHARDGQLHAQQVRKATAEAKLAEKKLAQSDFKPKKLPTPKKK